MDENEVKLKKNNPGKVVSIIIIILILSYSQPFLASRDLLDHMVDAHAPPAEGKMSRCKVKGCSTSHKPRGVLICHFRDNHCQCISPDEIEKSKDFRVSLHAILSVSYTHLRAHETDSYLVCRLLLEKKKK